MECYKDRAVNQSAAEREEGSVSREVLKHRHPTMKSVLIEVRMLRKPHQALDFPFPLHPHGRLVDAPAHVAIRVVNHQDVERFVGQVVHVFDVSDGILHVMADIDR